MIESTTLGITSSSVTNSWMRNPPSCLCKGRECHNAENGHYGADDELLLELWNGRVSPFNIGEGSFTPKRRYCGVDVVIEVRPQYEFIVDLLVLS